MRTRAVDTALIMVADTSEAIRTPFRENAVLSGKRFKARLLRSGVVSYRDCGLGNELLSKPTIDACISSFVGKPIVPRHKMLSTEEIATLARENGVIDKVSYNAEDEWFYAEGEAKNPAILARINAVGKVSCGYMVTRQSGKPGSRNNVPYDTETLGFLGNHLAIEEKPRYEEADIRWNSLSRQGNPNQNTHMFKWFKKQNSAGADDAAAIAAAAAKKKQEQEAAAAEAARLNSTNEGEEIAPDTEIMVGDKKVTLGELVTAYGERQNAVTEGTLPADAALEIDGKQVPAAEVIAGYRANAAKAAAPVTTAGKVFRLSQAKAAAAAAPVTVAKISTVDDQIKAGKELY